MAKLTICQMNGHEARKHYDRVVAKRFTKAETLYGTAYRTKDKTSRKVLLVAAEQQLDKATALSRPYQEWQELRAIELRDTKGIAAAAGFLAAHGWRMDAARALLQL